MRKNTLRSSKKLLDIVLCAAAVCACSSTSGTPGEAALIISGEVSSSSSSPHLREVDGGPTFYDNFRDGLPSSPTFFPLALWMESVVDDTGWPIDKAAGINTYAELVAGTELNRIAANGMYAFPSWAAATDPVAGYFTADEVDMWGGPGDSAATGNDPGIGEICSPPQSKCGYTVLAEKTATIPPEKMVYTNYGKGVAFWNTDDEAARFVNDYQDVISVDAYWFTDPNICGHSEGGQLLDTVGTVPDAQCRLAANYGRTVDRVRSLVEPNGSKPVWGFVELSRPFKDPNGPAISTDQIRAAVWSSLIHGARGIVYFNHNFSGDCQSQHVLRDCDTVINDAVTAVNDEVTRLAPVLNAPFVDDLLTAATGVDTMAKMYDGTFYVIAGSADADTRTMSLEIRCGEGVRADVMGENRTLPIIDGTLVDEFADSNTVHIYKIMGGNTCGLS